jgi:glycerol kinase
MAARSTCPTASHFCNDIDAGWSDDLCVFGVPRPCLPEVRPSSGRFGVTTPGRRRARRAVTASPVISSRRCSGKRASDRQPDLGEHVRHRPFVLMNLGPCRTRRRPRGLTSDVDSAHDVRRMWMEGAIFVTGPRSSG